jgi:hypothetical protein
VILKSLLKNRCNSFAPASVAFNKVVFIMAQR